MPFIRVKGFQKNFPMGSAEFMTECARIAGLLNSATASRPGTLGALIVVYRSSPAFQGLAPRTQQDYQRYLDYFQPIADIPLARFDRQLIVRIRDKANEKHQWRFANYVRAVLSILFSYGLERD